MSKFRATFFLVISMLSGCYSAPIVKSDEPLSDNRLGFLLVGAERSWNWPKADDLPILQLLYRNRANSRFEMGTVLFSQSENLVLQKLPTGDYYMYNSFFGSRHMALPEIEFKILPGKITYIGTYAITVTPKFNSWAERTLSINDNHQAISEELRKRYPKIFIQNPLEIQVKHLEYAD